MKLSMQNTEIIKNSLSRYDFISNKIDGNVFDHQPNLLTAYHSSKILLQNNVTDVYSCNDIFSKKIISRSLNHERKIIFKIHENQIFKEYFDNILSFENLNHKNYEQNLKKYFELLKEDGKLILVVLNDGKKKSNNIENNLYFSIKDLEKKLSLKFEINEVYSQRFLEKANNEIVNNLGLIRKTSAKLLKKIDKNKEVYVKIFQKTMKKINTIKENIEKIPDEDFIPKKYDDDKQPFFLLLICKKIKT